MKEAWNAGLLPNANNDDRQKLIIIIMQKKCHITSPVMLRAVAGAEG